MSYLKKALAVELSTKEGDRQGVKAQAAHQLEAGKVVPIRQGATEAHSLDQYPEVFQVALDEVALQDPRGEALRQIRQDSPETWDRIQAAEDEVNRLWQEAQKGRPVWEEYCQAVENWKTMFIRAIEDEKRLMRLAQERRSGKGTGKV